MKGIIDIGNDFGRIFRFFSNNYIRLLWVGLYRLSLDFAYILIINPFFNYSGFLLEFDIIRFIFSWILTIVISGVYCVVSKRHSPSSWLMSALIVLNLLPGIVMHVYKPMPYINYYIIYWMLLIIMQSFFINAGWMDTAFDILLKPAWRVILHFENLLNHGRIKKSKRFRVVPFVLFVWKAILIASAIYIWAVYADFHVQLDLFDVYNLRARAKALDMPNIFRYLFSFSKILFPIFIGVSFSKKQYAQVALWILSASLLFFIDGSKSIYFSTVAVFIVSFLCKDENPERLWDLIVVALIVLIVIGNLEYQVNGTYRIANSFVRRGLFVPSGLNYYYYDFFSQYQPDYFRSSVLRRFGTQSPYFIQIPNLIGYNYLGSIATHANNGLFSDAFANFGAIGVTIMPIILGGTMRFMDYCLKGTKMKIAIIPVILFTFSFISSTYFTVVWTHGFLVTCLTFGMYKIKDGWYK